MKNKIPNKIRSYVLQQLRDYKHIKKIIAEFPLHEYDLRYIAVLCLKMAQIDKSTENLPEEYKEVFNLLIDGYNWKQAEIEKGISKNAYYNAIDKIVVSVAKEMNLY